MTIEIDKLKGKTMFFVEQIGNRKIAFYCQDGHIYEMLEWRDKKLEILGIRDEEDKL